MYKRQDPLAKTKKLTTKGDLQDAGALSLPSYLTALFEFDDDDLNGEHVTVRPSMRNMNES
eukprot:scaffold654418_cov61-Prasinocladus_malaysianus.AAC.1